MAEGDNNPNNGQKAKISGDTVCTSQIPKAQGSGKKGK